jgi:beta-glucosidase
VQLFRQGGYTGEIGIALNVSDTIPASTDARDIAAAHRFKESNFDIFTEPLFKGIYPKDLMEWLGPVAPKVEPGDMQIIASPIDFLGLNYYFTQVASFAKDGGILKLNVHQAADPFWGRTEMGWSVHPVGLYNVIMDYKGRYDNPKMYITENGTAALDAPNEKGYVEDRDRIHYLRAHLMEVHKAIQAGANMQGYFLWSLFDNFEWSSGFKPRFGIVRVNYETQERITKLSGRWYSEVIGNNAVSE